MPDYITMAEMAAHLPGKILTQALDDNQDGVADSDVWDAVRQAAQNEIDGYLSALYAVPFGDGNIPALVKHAARVFASELLYTRRGKKGENNPFTKEADKLRKQLQDIADGKKKLEYASKREVPSASIVFEDAKTVSNSGKTTA